MMYLKSLEIIASMIMDYVQVISAPGLSWDAMLKMTKVKLKLIKILTCTYSLKKVQEVEFLIFLIDIVKPTINN